MAHTHDKRSLETIPVGSLGVIALDGCRELAERVDDYLIGWREDRENEHKNSLVFSGYMRNSYLLDVALIYALLGFTATTLLTRLLKADRTKGDKKE